MQFKLSHKQKDLIERFGVFFEKRGLSPAQARITGLLMIVDEAELTFEDICNSLQLSKSAVSKAIHFLYMIGRIEYHTKPGDRRRYFSVSPGKSEKDPDGILDHLSSTVELYKEILDSRSKSNPTFNAEIKRQIEFIEFLHVEFTQALKKWKRHK